LRLPFTFRATRTAFLPDSSDFAAEIGTRAYWLALLVGVRALRAGGQSQRSPGDQGRPLYELLLAR
jgi:hypothetical protein